jgi:hypothetical protein
MQMYVFRPGQPQHSLRTKIPTQRLYQDRSDCKEALLPFRFFQEIRQRELYVERTVNHTDGDIVKLFPSPERIPVVIHKRNDEAMTCQMRSEVQHLSGC